MVVEPMRTFDMFVEKFDIACYPAGL